jgi:hypothetical protein
MSYVQNEPVAYMDLQTLWNDRRDPHANPMSSSPRREDPRGKGGGGLAKAVEGLFSHQVGDDGTTSKLPDERLYQGQR